MRRDDFEFSIFNELYILGDFTLGKYDIAKQYRDRIRCRNVFLIWGNHDKPKDFRDLAFKSFSDIKRIHVDKQAAVLCHYPMRSWDGKGKGTFQLYGHCHGTMPGEGRQMDVGVDTNNFYPWAWEDIRKKMLKIPYDIYE